MNELLQQTYMEQQSKFYDEAHGKQVKHQTLEDVRVLRKPRQLYGYALAQDALTLFPEVEDEAYNIFNYASSIKVDDTCITKPEGYEADNTPITEKEAAELLHADPTNPADLDKLLDNFQEIHFKSGIVVYSEAYFNEQIKPFMNEEELAKIQYIEKAEIKDLLTLDSKKALDIAEAEDKYGSANVDDIVNSKEYQQEFDAWAAHMDEDAAALEIALREDKERESEAEAEHFKEINI